MQTPGAPPLSLAIAGLDLGAVGLPGRPGRAAGSRFDSAAGASAVRELLTRLRPLGFAAVQIDATMPGLRARELDRSARRDLASLLRQSELVCSGLDLFIPPEHFEQPANVDRAVAATLEALGLAADLGSLGGSSVAARASRSRVTVSLTLPEKLPPDVAATLSETCMARGVRLADHAVPIRKGADRESGVAVGVDPAAMLSSGLDPVLLVSGLGELLASARLSDVSRSFAGVRVGPGSGGGKLDLLEYQIALHTAAYNTPVVLDLRAVQDQTRAMETAVKAWGVALSSA